MAWEMRLEFSLLVVCGRVWVEIGLVVFLGESPLPPGLLVGLFPFFPLFTRRTWKNLLI
jgi:hypothetical protein